MPELNRRYALDVYEAPMPTAVAAAAAATGVSAAAVWWVCVWLG